MLSVFQRLTRSNLVPHRAARRELEEELAKGRAAEAELQRAYHVLEERIAQRADELAKVNEELRRKLQQGSQQAQGEVLELELETLLANAFPFDAVSPVPKGVGPMTITMLLHNTLKAAMMV